MVAGSRVKKLIAELDVDASTDGMSDEALLCRARGHRWEDRAMTRKRYNELLLDGLMIDAMYCAHGCGCTWEITWSIRDGEVITAKRDYPKDKSYQMPKGMGRLSRKKARVARVARTLAAVA